MIHYDPISIPKPEKNHTPLEPRSLSRQWSNFMKFEFVQWNQIMNLPIGSMVLVYMLTWLGYIDGIHVTIYIYIAAPWILWVMNLIDELFSDFQCLS